jgi:hypothetical protein
MAIENFAGYVKNMIDREFQAPKKFEVRSESQIYKDDGYIHAQKGGVIPSIAEVWFDGDWLCDISSDMFPKDAIGKIEMSLITKLNKK